MKRLIAADVSRFCIVTLLPALAFKATLARLMAKLKIK